VAAPCNATGDVVKIGQFSTIHITLPCWGTLHFTASVVTVLLRY